MIPRKTLIDHIEEELCKPSDYDENPDDFGIVYVNLMDGRECLIPNYDQFTDSLAVFILRALNVDPWPDIEDHYNAITPTIDKLIVSKGA